jgi:hypothetical protein
VPGYPNGSITELKSFPESFRRNAIEEGTVAFFGAAGQHLRVLRADDVTALS